MEWATSSSARALTGVLAILFALAPVAVRAEDGSADEDPWRAARAILAEAMFLESGLGNLQAACDLYEEGLADRLVVTGGRQEGDGRGGAGRADRGDPHRFDDLADAVADARSGRQR